VQNRIGLVNENGILIHHVGDWAWNCAVAFILNECAAHMVNRWFAAIAKCFAAVPA
jgi:hypothetical protein